ncbi:MAG: 3-isopropylmalate dehydratase large subunit [Clostridia bacterium]|nr:3-isopropylmalate dehydratase large subunit [Clostridia bacterium]
MHAIQKILAKAAGKPSVQAGEIVTAKVDLGEVNDLYLQTIYSFYEMGAEKVSDPDKIIFVFDHYAPAPTINAAQIHKEMRAFVQEQGLTRHFDIDAGVCHQVMPEAGRVRPGMVLVATDSHTTTHGAFGAFGTGVGATDMAAIMATGELWFRVPSVMKIRLEGQPGPKVLPKDVALKCLEQVRADGAVYQAIEFCGSYVEALDVPGRMVVCNLAVEMGAKTAYMQPNQAVLDYVNERTQYPYEVVYTDPDFEYTREVVIDVNGLSPQIAVPWSVDNVKPIEEVDAVAFDQGFIGACTGGRFEDIHEAYEILKGKHIAPGRRLVIIPASKEVMAKAADTGEMQALMQAGATFCAPGCGPCLGVHEGLLTKGERCITASNRNFPGRMGSTQAEIYLASPATVAASMLTGVLTDPRTV